MTVRFAAMPRRLLRLGAGRVPGRAVAGAISRVSSREERRVESWAKVTSGASDSRAGWSVHCVDRVRIGCSRDGGGGVLIRVLRPVGGLWDHSTVTDDSSI